VNQRQFRRARMKSALAKAKEKWKAHCKKERAEKRVPMTFEQWLGVDA